MPDIKKPVVMPRDWVVRRRVRASIVGDGVSCYGDAVVLEVCSG